MTICVCCSRGLSRAYGAEHKRCPTCRAKNCSPLHAGCDIEEPAQDPTKGRNIGDEQDRRWSGTIL